MKALLLLLLVSPLPAAQLSQDSAPSPQTPAASAPSPLEAMRESVARQRQAVEQMRASVEQQRRAAAAQRAFLPSLLPSAILFPYISPAANAAPGENLLVRPPAPCDPLPPDVWSPLVRQAAEREGVAVDLLTAVIQQESAFRPCAVSPKGAMGLMQLMPSTAALLGVKDPFDPKENVDAGTRFLKMLLDRYSGNLALALGAYNAGPGRVDAAGGVPPIPETQDYVKEILSRLVQ